MAGQPPSPAKRVWERLVLLRMAAKSSGGFVFDGGALHASVDAISPSPEPLVLDPLGDHSVVAQWVESRVDGGVLILDDLQWADQDTLAVIGSLTRSVQLLVGIRAGDSGATAALRRVSENGFGLVRLEPLAPEHTTQLVHYWAPELPEHEVGRVVDASHGNPWLLQHLAKDGGRSPILRLLMGARLRHLSPAAREAISLAGLLGRPVERDLLGTSAGELVEAGLLLEDGERLAPCHPLLTRPPSGSSSPSSGRRCTSASRG